jgi:hypothetical protein
MGRRPELKSDEKSKTIPLFIEIPSCEDSFTAEKVLHFIGARPRIPNLLSGVWCESSGFDL